VKRTDVEMMDADQTNSRLSSKFGETLQPQVVGFGQLDLSMLYFGCATLTTIGFITYVVIV
jgi:hypothetical protein